MNQNFAFKDHAQESRLFQHRAWFAFGVVVVLSVILLSRMFNLQIREYDTYRTQADSNRITIEPVAPTRGLIYDRNGLLLADNQPSYAVTLLKERIKDLDATLQGIGAIIDITPEQISRFRKRLAQRRRPNTSVALRDRLNETEIARLAARLHQLPGVKVEAKLIRNYPHHEVLAHTLGYVGRINQRELTQLTEADEERYRATHYIGKTGLEKFYESQLHGDVGYQTVETDARGEITRVLKQTPPKPGANLRLHLDMYTQQVAVAALGDRRGSVVAIDPQTGGVLAFASTPAFNPNLFVTGIDHDTYNALNQSSSRPLFNRAVKGQYPPGSTIKPLVALAGLDAGTADWDYQINDPGWFRLENKSHRYRDWKRGGHGTVDLAYAIMQSCDTYFYELAFDTGIDKLHDFLAPFGLGAYTNIDFAGERKGVLPSRAWKRAHKNQPWYPGETLIAGIGQGYMSTTPLQLALATAILANRGRLIQPQMTQSINNQRLPSKPGKQITLRDPSDWQRVIQSMRDVVHHPKGTATKLSQDLDAYDIAGKTGTAQVIGIKQNEEYDAESLAEALRDHALFVGFAPVENPRIAVAAIVENGGSGGTTAGPVVRAVMDAYLNPPPSHEKAFGPRVGAFMGNALSTKARR